MLAQEKSDFKSRRLSVINTRIPFIDVDYPFHDFVVPSELPQGSIKMFNDIPIIFLR